MAWPVGPTWALNFRDGGGDEVLGGPVLLRAAEGDDEVFEQRHAVAGVGDLGVELHGPDAALVVGDAGDGVGGLRGDAEAGGERLGVVAVGHPDGERGGQAVEDVRGVGDGDFGVAVLVRCARHNACPPR